MEYIVYIVSALLFGYWYGHGRGRISNLQAQLTEILDAFPVNIEIYKVADTYYARIMIIGQHLAQSKNYDELVDMASDKFPGRTIIISEVDE